MSPTRIMTTSAAVVAAVLVVVLALVLTHSPRQMSSSPVLSPTSPTATRGMPASPSSVATVDPRSRIHNASPNAVPLFASITFTAPTTYDQAVAVLAQGATTPYGENCDGIPGTPFPGNYPHTMFDASHMLLISSPTWNQLLQIAAASAVISVDGTPLYPCP